MIESIKEARREEVGLQSKHDFGMKTVVIKNVK